MADTSALTNVLGTNLGSSINNLASVDPTKGISEQLYLQQSKNILDTQKNMALEEIYSKGQAADWQKSQSDAYLAKQKQMYEDTREKTKKLEDQQNWEYPEFHPTQTNLQEMATIFSLVGIVGTMLGGGGRNAGMNALSSMTGMMEGWKKGEKDRFLQEKTVFDENVKVMERKNNALQKQIEKIARDFTTNREAAKDEYAILLAQNPYLKKVDAYGSLKAVISAASEMNKGMLNLLEFKEKQRDRAEARAGRTTASYQYVEKDGKVYAVNTKDPSDIREVDPKLAGATKLGATKTKGTIGGAIQFRYNSVVTNSVDQLGIEMDNMNAYKASQLPPELGNALTNPAKGVFTGLESYLAQGVTDEEARLFQQSAAGVKQAMTNVEASGLPRGSSASALSEYGKMEVKGGDTPLAKAMYFALVKQVANLGVRDLQTNGGTPEQIERAQKSAKEVNKIVPYTVKDVIELAEKSKSMTPQQKNKLANQVTGMSNYINLLRTESEKSSKTKSGATVSNWNE